MQSYLQLHSQATKSADTLDVLPSLKIFLIRYVINMKNLMAMVILEKANTEIPVASRILAVVRDYDKFVSSYATSRKFQSKDALRQLRNQAHQKYDSDFVDAFEHLLNNIPAILLYFGYVKTKHGYLSRC